MSLADWDIFLQNGVTTQSLRKDESVTSTPPQVDLYQVVSGRVKVEEEGRVMWYEEGDVFGEVRLWEWLSLGKESTPSLPVAASKKADVLVLDGKYLHTSLSRNPRLRSHFLVFLSSLSTSRLSPSPSPSLSASLSSPSLSSSSILK